MYLFCRLKLNTVLWYSIASCILYTTLCRQMYVCNTHCICECALAPRLRSTLRCEKYTFKSQISNLKWRPHKIIIMSLILCVYCYIFYLWLEEVWVCIHIAGSIVHINTKLHVLYRCNVCLFVCLCEFFFMLSNIKMIRHLFISTHQHTRKNLYCCAHKALGSLFNLQWQLNSDRPTEITWKSFASRFFSKFELFLWIIRFFFTSFSYHLKNSKYSERIKSSVNQYCKYFVRSCKLFLNHRKFRN